MAKDPATLWYWNDWHGGTITLSRHLKGCYMDLLHAQFNGGPLSLDEIKTVLGSDFGSAWPTLQKKFEKNDNNLFFNRKALETQEKRKKYSESRRANLSKHKHMKPHMGKHMDAHMENEIEIENRNEKINGVLHKNEIFEQLFTDEIWLDQMRITHKGKDIKQAWEECYTHHSQNPNSKNFETWEWKQKLNTWLSIKKTSITNGTSKKTEHTASLMEGFRKRHGVTPE